MRLLFGAFFVSSALAFCQTMTTTAYCFDHNFPYPGENGCCVNTDDCPRACLTKQIITNPDHINGYWANGTQYSRQCICRFCLGSSKQIGLLRERPQERLLRAHNFFRCLHDIPPHSTWSFALENQVKREDEYCILLHSKTFDEDPMSGENKAKGTSLPELAVAMWYIEIVNIDPKTMESFNGRTVGHYTAMMWKDTKKVGCGYCNPKYEWKYQAGKKTTPDKEEVWTCHYGEEVPNNKLKLKNNLPPLRKKPRRTMDQCCNMVYPEWYDQHAEKLHEQPEFMWMDYDRLKPEALTDKNDRRSLEEEETWNAVWVLHEEMTTHRESAFEMGDFMSL